MSSTIVAKVVEQLETLPENLQQRVLAFVQTLQVVVRSGIPGKRLLSFAGAIPPDDLQLMRQAIETGCEQIDLSERRRLLDLGGGPGTYAIHFCQSNPQLQATIFDLPTTQPFAEATLQRFSMADRINFIAGDFIEGPVPDGYDAAWLSHVLHGEGYDGRARLLVNAVAALEPGGMLMVQEFILDAERKSPLFPALFSLNMLLGTPAGQAYSEPELFELFYQAGLKQVQRIQMELPNGAGVVVGIKS